MRRLAVVACALVVLATTAGTTAGCCRDDCADQGASARPLAPDALAILDWERTVLGPRGRAAPGDDAVTERTVTRAQAERRARRAGGVARVVAVAPQLGLEGGGFVALGSPPAVDARELVTATSSYEPVSDDAVVRLDLTPAGQRDFTRLTQQVARRAAGRRALDDQHYAIIVEGTVVARPTVFEFDAAGGQSAQRGVEIAEIDRGQATTILTTLSR